MGALERFLARSVRDTQLDKVAEALLGSSGHHAPVASDNHDDAVLVREAIKAAGEASKHSDEVELQIHIEYK